MKYGEKKVKGGGCKIFVYPKIEIFLFLQSSLRYESALYIKFFLSQFFDKMSNVDYSQNWNNIEYL